MYNLTNADLGDVAKDLVDARAIVFGTPTVLGKMHPLAVYAAHLVKALKPPLKLGVVLTSYGWGKGALAHAVEVLGPTENPKLLVRWKLMGLQMKKTLMM